MARSNPYRPFIPNPEQMALRPALAGNAINGLGESTERPPRMVYWAPDPDAIPTGAWLTTRSPGVLLSSNRVTSGRA
jgi:epoxyqueuosine reductase